MLIYSYSSQQLLNRRCTEICANEFGGGDYLPKMASTYAADPVCSFLGLTKNNTDDGDKILAVANYKRLPAQNSAWIEAVRTHPNHRNQGLASSLLRSIVDLSKHENKDAMPPTDILTCTIQSNVGMVRALEKEGFAICNTIQILRFEKLKELPGWSASIDEVVPRPLLDALNLKHMVSPTAKAIPSSSWRTLSSNEQLLEKLQQCKSEGATTGYLPGLYEYIVPGPNRLDLQRSMEHGLVLALDVPAQQKETSRCETNEEGEEEVGHAILVLTRDDRISSLRSNWVCSIVAHTQLAFEVALWHAHSLDVAKRMQSSGLGVSNAESEAGTVDALPFCLVFDDAVPLTPGTLAHALPRVTDECIVFSYR